MNRRIGGVQLGPFTGNLQTSVDRVINFIEKAEDIGIELLCFPELCTTPYFPKSSKADERWFFSSENRDLQRVVQSTLGKNIAVIFPYAEKADDGNFNSAIVIKGGRVIGKYRKIHLPAPEEDFCFCSYEQTYFNVGNLGFPLCTVGNINIGIQICFDRHFPEGFRILAVKGSQVIFLATNSPGYGYDSHRMAMWERLLQVRAYENGVFIVAANKTGVEDGWDFMGNSLIVDPQGNFVTRLGQEEGLFYADIDISDKKKSKFLYGRKPGYYQELVSCPNIGGQ